MTERRGRGHDNTTSQESEFVTDPDVDLHDPQQVAETKPRQWDTVVAVGLGGIVGAESRYGIGLSLPHAHDEFPWATVLVNATGCLLLGVLMVILLELTSPHRLVRPFLGVGVLGGYTTFSTFTTDAGALLQAHRPLVALLYVLTTMIACGMAVWVGSVTTQAAGQAVIHHRLRRRNR